MRTTHFTTPLQFVLAMSVLSARPATCAAIDFEAPRSYRALGDSLQGANAVAAGDFNSDGKPDLAAVTPATDGVSVFLNSGHGRFGNGTHVPAGNTPSYVAVGDFNGDGKADLISPNVGPGTVTVSLGKGDGSFHEALASPAGVFPGAVALGDFDHDARLDVAVAGGSAGVLEMKAVHVLLGNGDGTFEPPLANLVTDYQYWVTTADFNGDTHLDLAAGSGIQAWVLLGNGDGTFQAARSLPVEGGSSYGNSAAAGDLNGDSKPDLAVANSTHQRTYVPGTVTILLGNGDGTFLPVPSIQTGQFPYSVALADYDSDGKLDVAECEAGEALIRIFPGNGDGTFQPGIEHAVGGQWLNCLAPADFNGDSRPDLAVSSGFSDNVSVLLSKTAGFREAVISSEGKQPDTVFASQPYGITTADFNDDGKMDAAVANTNTDDVSILLGNGDGSFAPPVQYTVGDFPGTISAADFDSDSHVDLAVVNHSASTVSILLGNGDGTFREQVVYPAGAIFALVRDFNADGKLDIATVGAASDGTQRISLLAGNGDGTFGAALHSSFPGSGGNGAELGDFNSDNKPDILVVNFSSDDAIVLLGSGDGTFAPAAPLSVADPNSLATGDFNRDGKDDAVVVEDFGNRARIFLGRGDGSFDPQPQRYAVGDGAFFISAGDLDGDLLIDLAIPSSNYHYVTILQGNGDGSFTPAGDFGVSRGATGVALADFNGDAKPDVITSGFWRNKVSVLLNRTRSVQMSALARSQTGPSVVHGKTEAGESVSIEASPDLSPGTFTFLATVQADASGVVRYEDAEAANLPRRFYRLVVP